MAKIELSSQDRYNVCQKKSIPVFTTCIKNKHPFVHYHKVNYTIHVYNSIAQKHVRNKQNLFIPHVANNKNVNGANVLFFTNRTIYRKNDTT